MDMNKKSIKTRNQAREAKQAVLSKVVDIPEITGVGISYSQNGYSVRIHLSKPLKNGIKIPSQINDVPIVIEVVGISRPFKTQGLEFY